MSGSEKRRVVQYQERVKRPPSSKGVRILAFVATIDSGILKGCDFFNWSAPVSENCEPNFCKGSKPDGRSTDIE